MGFIFKGITNWCHLWMNRLQSLVHGVNTKENLLNARWIFHLSQRVSDFIFFACDEKFKAVVPTMHLIYS